MKMFWFILLFPLLIYPWGPEPYYTLPKVLYLYIFVISTWIIIGLKRKYWTQYFEKRILSIEIIALIFICLVGISSLFSVNKTISVFGSGARFEGLLTLISYCSIFLFSYRLMSAKHVNKILPGMVVVSVLVSIYGILQHYSLDFLPRRRNLSFDYDRSYSFFDNPNFFGSYTVLVITLTLTLFLIAAKKKSAIFLYTTTCITFSAMLFSSTRSSWVGLFIGILLLTGFLVRKRRDLWKRWSILLLTLSVIFLFINAIEKGGYLERLGTTFGDSYKVVTHKGTGQEGSYRLFIWNKAFPLLGKYYLTGSGPDTFRYVFPNEDKEKKKIFGNIIVDKAHNEYLQMAITLGIPALLTYLVLVFMVLKRAFQAAKKVMGNEKIILYGLISTICGYLVQAFFNISVVPVAPLYWSLLGITYATSSYYLRQRKSSSPNEELYKGKSA
jgi:putative inorganic carbon (HCO3(-)) transporter